MKTPDKIFCVCLGLFGVAVMINDIGLMVLTGLCVFASGLYGVLIGNEPDDL